MTPNELDGQHGFARPRPPVDDGRVAGFEIPPQRIKQSLPAYERGLGGNYYLASNYLHETISNLEAHGKRGGLRAS